MKKRLLEIVDYYAISVRKFEEECGLKRGNISNMSDDSSIGSDKLSKIIDRYSNINIEWLLTGSGEMLKKISSSAVISASTKEKDPQYINLYDVSASAGIGSFDEMISKEKVIGEYVIPDFRNIDWMIYVKGSSMYPKYSSGDIIACRVLHESRFIQWGKVYVVATREQGILVKRLEEENGKAILAKSDNPDYNPFWIPKDEIQGIALVVGVIRME